MKRDRDGPGVLVEIAERQLALYPDDARPPCMGIEGLLSSAKLIVPGSGYPERSLSSLTIQPSIQRCLWLN